MDGLELILAVEEAFDVEIPDAQAQSIRTVGDLYDWLIAVKLEPPGGTLPASTPRTREQIWGTLHAIIVETLFVRPDEVTPAARFMEDLKMD